MIKKISLQEKMIASLLQRHGISFFQQYKFHPARKWVSDFGLPDHRIILEYEGGSLVGWPARPR